jgi:hypothetical protein
MVTLTDKYRATFFANELTVDVLHDILCGCSFFCKLDVNDPAQVAAHNIGKAILSSCGVLSDDNTIKIVRAFGNIPPPAQEEVDG